MAVKVIAEVGINHNGDVEIAKKMIILAKEAGADFVKFQTFVPEKEVSKFALLAEYQKKLCGNVNQLEMIKKYQLMEEDFIELKEFCGLVGIEFLSTPSDLDSIEILKRINVPIWKIPSNEITDYPYLVEIAKTKKPVILSTGMCELCEIEQAINVLKINGSNDIKLLHCTTEYPAPFEEVNLNAMLTLKRCFGLPVGYSDHTVGIEISIAAVALGAEIIEKHFTLDRNMEGPDHKASIEPIVLKNMIESIRKVEISLGKFDKKATQSEIKNIPVTRKSIVALKNIKKDEIFCEKNITTKRPGYGISPMLWNDIIGMKATRDFAEDEMIEI